MPTTRYTVEMILTRYPDLKSIRDFGNVFDNPWKDKFFTLLGRESSLDKIEHEMLRKPGVYDEPRVHFAVNCASIGCPMLREEAFVAERLDAQLEEQARRFLSDRTRNRYNAAAGSWKSRRSSTGSRRTGPAATGAAATRPVTSREHFFARYATSSPTAGGPQARRRTARPIAYLDYDWSPERRPLT